MSGPACPQVGNDHVGDELGMLARRVAVERIGAIAGMEVGCPHFLGRGKRYGQALPVSSTVSSTELVTRR